MPSRPQALLQFVHGTRQQLLRSAAVLHDPRKLPPLAQLVSSNGVLDIAAQHARHLQTAADELFKANEDLRFGRVPLFNIPSAMDVLSTGTYSSLPASIKDMQGPRALPEAQQQRLVQHLNHLLYSQLLKAHLPPCLELVQVTGGYAVLSCQGLYEVQLSLFQQPYPPQLAEAQEAAAAAAAQQADGQQQVEPGGQQQQQQQANEAGTSAAAAAAAEQQEDGASGPTSSPTEPGVQVRWQWTLTHAVLLPNAAAKPPLRQVQLEQLLRALRERMWYAADAAAVEAAKRGAAGLAGDAAAAADRAPAGSAAAAASGRTASQQQSVGGSSGQTSTAQPAASGTTGGSAACGISGASASGRDAAKDAGRELQLDKFAADEVTIPLRVMHGVLRDVAAQVLLHEVRAAAEKLAGPGSRWEGHLKLSRAEVLTPGIRMHYWQQVPVLLAQQPAGGSSSGAAAAADAAATATLPAVEVGLGSDGTAQVMHLPPLRVPGSLQQVPLLLDSHTVDMEGLLLQAVAVTASTQLQILRRVVGQLLRQRGLEPFAQLQLCSFGQAPKEAPPAAAAAVRDSDTGEQQPAGSSAAAITAAVIGGSSSSSNPAGDSSSSISAAGVRMPEQLVLVLDGNMLVAVSFQPWSGRAVLRPGSAFGGELNMEMNILLRHHQEALQAKQEAALQQQWLPAAAAVLEVSALSRVRVSIPCTWPCRTCSFHPICFS
ncbi:hypothetical protein COO60DRAFT_1101947 [Scenedesmus sp. NREL 46B-D3]|nr:hypothetical protein COO60DRAFT_1101947 [Scenedesmus sp. NREL 46B-D3]